MRCAPLYPVGIDHHDLMHSDEVGEPGELTRDELLAALIEDAEAAYASGRPTSRRWPAKARCVSSNATFC